jgi:hypothetical protein
MVLPLLTFGFWQKLLQWCEQSDDVRTIAGVYYHTWSRTVLVYKESDPSCGDMPNKHFKRVANHTASVSFTTRSVRLMLLVQQPILG